MTDEPHGFDRGLTNYGDREFVRFLRRSFARSMGLSRSTLNKPIVGIAMTPSGFNCDKTVPPQLMGAASVEVPAIHLVTGPMMTGRHKGQRLGACTDCRGFWAKYRANSIDSDEIETVEGR